MTISLSEFRGALSELAGLRFETLVRKQGFALRVFEEGPEYIPESSGEPREDSWSSIGRIIDRFNETGSYRPVDYQDLTYHSSYVLAILRHVIGRGEQPIVSDGGSSVNTALPMIVSTELTATPESNTPSSSKPHQRIGAVSNAHVGSDFERVAHTFFAEQGIVLSRNFPLEIGLAQKKVHYFDLGNAEARVLVECKSHRWTAGGSVPSAKMTVWNEAMFYFLLAPAEYRKVLFVLHDKREGEGESLLSYYRRTNRHLVPDGVEFLEWDEVTCAIVGV